MPLTFQEGCYTGVILFIYSLFTCSFKEILLFNTNKVNPTFLIQVVFTPVAEVNVYSWQDTHWSCSSDAHGDCTDKILSSVCSSACSFGHRRPYWLQEGNFWEERELSSGHSPSLMCKDIGWTEAVLVCGQKASKKKKKKP